VQRYREKDYQGATDLFSQSDNAQSNYNRGNALAFSKKYQEAIQAYDRALKLKPKMADAKYNREIIKKLLENQKKPSPSSSRTRGTRKNQNQKNQKQKDQKKQQKKEKQQAKAKKQESQKQKKMPQTAHQSEKQKRQARKNREKDQSEKQLLNNIPDDPGGLLRRKFQRDYERRQMEAKGW